MTATINRLPRVDADLAAIYDYIARDNESATERLIRRITASIEKLGYAPETGTLRPDLSPEARSNPVGNYLTLSRSTRECVTVVAVVHGSRDLPMAKAAFD